MDSEDKAIKPSPSLRSLTPWIVTEKGSIETYITRLTPEATSYIEKVIERQIQSQVAVLSRQLKIRSVVRVELVFAVLCLSIALVSAFTSLYFSAMSQGAIASLLLWPAASGLIGMMILAYATTRSDLVDEE